MLPFFIISLLPFVHSRSRSTLTESEILDRPHLEWSITDPSVLDQILSARNTHSFESQVFELNSFKWFLRLSPNGRTEQEHNSVMLALVLASLPDSIANITCKPTFILKETNTTYPFTKRVDFQQGSSYRWGSGTLSAKQLSKVTSISILVDVNILRLNDKNGILRRYEKTARFPMNQINASIVRSVMHYEYIWNLHHDLRAIKKAKTGKEAVWISPVFGNDGLFEWKLEFYPNGFAPHQRRTLLFVQVKCFIDEIGSVFIRYRLWLKESHTKFSYQRLITNPMKSFGWYVDTMPHDQLMRVNNITILCDIEVIEIYDRNNRIVTDLYAYVSVEEREENEAEYVVDKYGKISLVGSQTEVNNDTESVAVTEVDDVEVIDRNETEFDDVKNNMEKIETVSSLEDFGRQLLCEDEERDIRLETKDHLPVSILLKIILVIYCFASHCIMFVIYQSVAVPSKTLHCMLAFVYYFVLFFLDSLPLD